MARRVKEKGGIGEPAKNMTTSTQRTKKLEKKVVSAPPKILPTQSHPAKMEVTKPSTEAPTPYQTTEKQ